MTNLHRGEIEAHLGGQTYRLVLTLGALAELEHAFGAGDLVGLAGRFEAGRMRARDLVAIIGCGLRGAGAALSDDEVAGLSHAERDSLCAGRRRRATDFLFKRRWRRPHGRARRRGDHAFVARAGWSPGHCRRWAGGANKRDCEYISGGCGKFPPVAGANRFHVGARCCARSARPMKRRAAPRTQVQENDRFSRCAFPARHRVEEPGRSTKKDRCCDAWLGTRSAKCAVGKVHAPF